MEKQNHFFLYPHLIVQFEDSPFDDIYNQYIDESIKRLLPNNSICYNGSLFDNDNCFYSYYIVKSSVCSWIGSSIIVRKDNLFFKHKGSDDIIHINKDNYIDISKEHNIQNYLYKYESDSFYDKFSYDKESLHIYDNPTILTQELNFYESHDVIEHIVNNRPLAKFLRDYIHKY